MAIIATALFGSKARGDGTEGSDTDVLLWTDETFPRHVKAGRLALALYPEAELLEKARRGDLFAAHVALEAVPLSDPLRRLEALRKAYAPPPSYAPQIAAASDLAWFLIDHAASFEPGLLNARTAWCARTVAIARCAEAGHIAFAANALCATLGSADLLALIGAKEQKVPVENGMARLERFVRAHGCVRPLRCGRSSMQDYKRHFSRHGNGFGLKTIRQGKLRDALGGYL